MEEKDQGRRLEEKKGLSRQGKIAVASAAGVVGLLLVIYLIFCGLARGDKALPGTYLGGVNLSGMTVDQAKEAMAQVSKERYETLEVPIQVEGETVVFSAKEAGVQVTGGVEEAVKSGRSNFFAGGWNYLTGILGHKRQLGFTVDVEDPNYLNGVFAQVTQAVDQPMEPPRWELEEDEESARLILSQGKTGQKVDLEGLRTALLDALGRGDAEPLTAQVTQSAPGQPDLDALARDIDREPVNAALDKETDEVVPHKLGLKVDTARAKEIFDSLAEGESATLELEVTAPEITTIQLRAGLFRDVLGEAKSSISGTANRVGNVKLAAAACNGVVLLPGEQFSYNQTTGERTYAKGYREAPGYTANGSVDMVGGGVCQPSSTLYYACLKANMEIVQRTNHRYNVGYVPDGMDATVSWPNLDYVFANNTPYPVKIELLVEGKTCIARLLGTKTDNTYIEMESNSYNYVPYETVYKADESVPQGTTKVVMSPHTGRTAQAYQNLYAADGTLISRTLISTDKYYPCNKIIAYNPLDGDPSQAVSGEANPQPDIDFETGLPMDANGNVILPEQGETWTQPAPAETWTEPAPAEPAPAQPEAVAPAVPEGIVVE